MHPVLEDLINLLKLERIEDNIFRGESRDIGSAQVFGGQVLGQALSAAHHTVDGRDPDVLFGRQAFRLAEIDGSDGPNLERSFRCQETTVRGAGIRVDGGKANASGS